MTEKTQTKYFASPMIFTSSPTTLIAKEKSISNIETLIKYSINQKKCRIEQMCLTFNPRETLYKLKINFDSKNPNTELIEQGFEIIKRKQETHIANCILPESTSELAITKAIKTLCKNTTIKFEKERLSIKKKVKDTYSYLIVEYKLNDINELNRLTSTRFIAPRLNNFKTVQAKVNRMNVRLIVLPAPMVLTIN
ncbi:hypothetical protein C9374_002333 [Naegleria lovaniensis]|uniref:Uncharacterized protein n=1 Tax=Naegleria lovaniensis TaxID=51637 RepID=A0AA88KM63_NAELO|nr:uncharacterized protein C9374_002333 [Naegleria lovaniensis]KAG2386589.1 hypothetical protein C9374_002333 [Naegleria lovaniensis]